MISRIAAIETYCEGALASPELRNVRLHVERRGLDVVKIAENLDHATPMMRSLLELQAVCGADEEGALERLVLLEAGRRFARQIESAPVSKSVHRLTEAAFESLVTGSYENMRVGHPSFLSAVKMLTLRRFPCGEYDWEVSGIPRSILFRVDKRNIVSLAYSVLWELRGLRPLFVTHVSIMRTGHLDEGNVLRSYYRMAESVALQPTVKGMMAYSWMRAPSLAAVTPRLAWLSSFFRENGGFVSDAGPADPDCGVLSRSTSRRKMYEDGVFTPMMGLALWPRRAMLLWAKAHPEYAG